MKNAILFMAILFLSQTSTAALIVGEEVYIHYDRIMDGETQTLKEWYTEVPENIGEDLHWNGFSIAMFNNGFQVVGRGGTAFDPADFDGYVIEFSESKIADVELDYNWTGMTNSNVTFADSSVTVDLRHLAQNGVLNVKIETAEVPLPAAAWLFLSAIGGLGILKRFRKS